MRPERTAPEFLHQRSEPYWGTGKTAAHNCRYTSLWAHGAINFP